MKNKSSILILLLLIFFLLQQFTNNFFIFIWVVILTITLINKKNHFISILLVLEILSLSNLIIIRVISRTSYSLNLIFILITLRVGEAVLGLAILVKLIRWSSSEFIIRGLN